LSVRTSLFSFQKVDVTSRAVMEIMTKTIEYLQPNPASRAKLSMINTMSKIRGQEKGPGYPQAEALLAEAMLKFGRELGDDCNFGNERFPHFTSFICPRGSCASKMLCRR